MFQFGDETEKKQTYRTIIEQLRLEELKLEGLFDKHTDLNSALTNNDKMSEALEETVTIYTEQVELQRKFHGSASSIHIQK